MTPLTTVKVTLALAGLVLFGLGIRLSHDTLRWVGLGLVALAWVTRFAGPRARRDGRPSPADADRTAAAQPGGRADD